ncbi:hypothetical protein SAMN02910447_00108 [Ruminococcus sp. YE71]|uniref:hypothetical protein n=1 Tax=unclassified Ruminococcus TaxID=2608920 RepID=UPI00088852B8|nr:MULTISPECIES: hypothetical protein [unclassified Ruminococcus]SDA10003.1 hypothetical protein SAMN02910446_00241 [Ruminococcus sp. YE78]SFW11179.1 hypothetical protein SAMN02910447_00108 [Ruminococcus sp. YE71]
MNDEEKRRQAMEEFERLKMQGEVHRRFEDRQAQLRRENMFRRSGYSYRTNEEEIEDLIEAAPAGIGVLFGVAIAFLLGSHDLGVYIILGSIGFYGGVFVKHNAFGNEDAVTAFRSTKLAFWIALAGVLAGFLTCLM